jgi:hypothetical protein
MREPKRLAHRQAERNKARALKRWGREDSEVESGSQTTSALEPVAAVESIESFAPADLSPFQV